MSGHPTGAAAGRPRFASGPAGPAPAASGAATCPGTVTPMADDAPTTATTVNSLLETGEVLVELGWAYGLPGDPDSGAGAWFFAATCDDPASALFAARDEWVEARRVELAGDDPPDYDFGYVPNWGDFVGHADDELLARHGLRRIHHHAAVHVNVDHDDTARIGP